MGCRQVGENTGNPRTCRSVALAPDRTRMYLDRWGSSQGDLTCLLQILPWHPLNFKTQTLPFDQQSCQLFHFHGAWFFPASGRAPAQCICLGSFSYRNHLANASPFEHTSFGEPLLTLQFTPGQPTSCILPALSSTTSHAHLCDDYRLSSIRL